MRELKNIEEKILDRALYLIGRDGTCNVSIRAIAREAQVNVSAINYYFRTKEEMLRQVRELYITNTLEIISIMDRKECRYEERLLAATNEILEYVLRFPGISVMLKDAEKREDATSKKVVRVTGMMIDGVDYLLEKWMEGNDESISFKRMIFWSSINYPAVNNELLLKDYSIWREKEERNAYIKYLLEMLRKK